MAKTTAAQRKQLPPAEKTKSAICFMCLFDGLRVPSIRRLIRRPHTFCDIPLCTFDPAFFSPDAENMLTDLYHKLFTGTCDCIIDPSIDQVMSALASHSNISQNQRVILHYFGYGCKQPGNDGSLFFFNESRSKYYSMQVTNFIGNCYAPLMLIFDCNNAGGLYKSVSAMKESKHLDLFALFSCSEGESLPMATDLPQDIFSMCLLQPYKMSIWWHKRQFESVVDLDMSHIEEDLCMRALFYAILNAIAVDTVSHDEYEALFHRDPAVGSLCRGFLLAQKILWEFGIKCVAIPSIDGAESNALWDFWDTAIDMAISNPSNVAESVFSMVMQTFANVPYPSAYPMFSYFMSVPEFHTRVASALLNLIDDMENPVNCALTKSDIWKTIVNLDMKSISVEALLLLAKLTAVSDISPFEQSHPLLFSLSTPTDLLRAGMLALCCSFLKPCHSSFHRLSMDCIRAPDECAPLHCLLFGLLEEKAGKFMSLPSSSQKFTPLLSSDRLDVRAAACFALGFTKSPAPMRMLIAALSDASWIVRNEALIAATKLVKFASIDDSRLFRQTITHLREDPVQLVRENAAQVDAQLQSLPDTSLSHETDAFIRAPESQLLNLLLASVRHRHFVKFYTTNIFRDDFT